ncbi:MULTISPECIES: hypothetical protein [Nostoc]|nr:MULTISPECIES: hypothetical protein [Nostoc]
MMDTEYVALAAKGYDLNIECLPVEDSHKFGAASQRSGVSPEHN